MPTLTAANRVDLAYATGFVHGQDRFFEMDLSRRLAAGELSELFGKAAVEQDKRTRLFHFRKVARAVIDQASPEQRALVEAYARGVNAGVSGLSSRPWEYWVLGAPPVPWRPEDTILVVHPCGGTCRPMALQRELLRREINARIGGKECDAGWKCGLRFFYPARTQWDAPDGVATDPGGTAAVASDIVPAASGIPGPDVLDVRAATAAAPPAESDSRWGVSRCRNRALVCRSISCRRRRRPATTLGSNNWAVAGRLTTTGAALVASDMHLGQRYRLSGITPGCGLRARDPSRH